MLMKDNAKSKYEEKYQLPSIYLHFFFCRFFYFHSIKVSFSRLSRTPQIRIRNVDNHSSATSYMVTIMSTPVFFHHAGWLTEICVV